MSRTTTKYNWGIAKKIMVSKIKTRPEVRSAKILAWYDRHQRHLPWRARPGVQPDPYFVWLSEIMLQQTTVVTVKSYFEHFIATWPKLEDLAAAPLDDILHAWQGLGYYARARNLHKCAQVVAAQYDGKFPDEEQDLLSLPGIGPYTAAAITAIAFGKKATPVDGNIERVMARLFAVMEPLPKSKSQLRDLAGGMTPDDRAGDYAQALMDIGATICTPKKPNCSICPLSGDCRAEKEGLASELPRRVPKKKKPTRYGTAFWLINPSGEIMLRRRREQGLLGGMIEVPSSDWQEKSRSSSEILDEAPVEIDWQMLPGKIRHTFTHFHLELEIAVGHLAVDSSVNGIWCDVNEFGAHALPTVMKKVVAHALEFQD